MFVCVCALVCVCVSFIKRVCCGNFWYCRIARIITLCDVVVLSHHGLERKLVVLYVCLCVCSVCVCLCVCRQRSSKSMFFVAVVFSIQMICMV